MTHPIISYIRNQTNQKINYAEYMAKVLYDPQYGYYMKQKEKVGKKGDFITTSNVHSIFAKVFCSIFHEVITKNNLPFIICEIGGGTGRFAYDLLKEWNGKYPDTYEELSYFLIEESPYHRAMQKEILGEFNNVHYSSSIDQLNISTFEGIVFSNELIDALPVHVIEKHNNVINEVFITVNELDELTEVRVPLENKEIQMWLDTYGPKLNNNQRIEIPLAMQQWIEKISQFVDKGAIFTVDYGYWNEEWQHPERRDGSLRGYYQHQMIGNPLLYPSDMDLTTHIQLDPFIKIGKEHGLETQLVATQDQFLLQAGILNYLQENYDPNPFSEISKQNRAIRSLITDGMSKAFHVILQTKTLSVTESLSFLKAEKEADS
ncbi:class I SAM-dependent methyltransferase [Alkalihalobacterium chitinilyticum]|uniref:SAM-dependent methyltransferase n=1 Tax=Alkalihalobacterium chitinilyticum TaxID=2980103 RepID=A0ABT5V9X6_9BACI|nr:SAM-dependent methyltransferase [Alkalihalobacterium chitinilyticum]MDE5412279.1 SAM-dependent methyltransferase [Alkalihalobacterium chitinilyticum]